MHTLILLAVLHGYVSIPPIRVFQPYHEVKCPRGYTIWWPAGQEFDDDNYAECIKPVRERPSDRLTDVSLKQKVVSKHKPR